MKRFQFGFTLIEIIVVVALIGILSVASLAVFGEARHEARVKKALADMEMIQLGMELLKADTGVYPNRRAHYCPPNGLPDNEVRLNLPAAGLLTNNPSNPFPNWNGPYVQGTVLDPWGMPYLLDEDYLCTAGAVGCFGHVSTVVDRSVIYSCGPDRDCNYNDDNVVLSLCPN